MQDMTSNLVYVVSLRKQRAKWSGSLTPVEIVTKKSRYFHPVGDGYPKEPPNYIGFRWDGCLQRIHHVDHYGVFNNPHDHFREIPVGEWRPHFLYTLGPAIIPQKRVRTGKLFRAQRVYAAFDLLLTCSTISEARDKTKARKDMVDGV